MRNHLRTISIALLAMLLLCSCGQNQPQNIVIPSNEPDEPILAEATPTAAPTPSPTPEPTPTSRPLLQLGDESNLVTELQARLYELGYLRAEATGYYGEKTQAALSAFQKGNGLEATGIADGDTQRLLFSESAAANVLPLMGYVIGLDAGHQAKSNAAQEPVSPGSSETKKKVSSGTQGIYTRVPEYQVNLDVALLLRDLLVEQGATVVMTRETNDVDISNVERAQFFNEQQTDYALRLHCNGTTKSSTHGAFMLVPTKNPYLEQCDLAAQLLIDAYCEATGAKNLGLTKRSDQTGFNWCERMIVNIEMGHMTNEEEDRNLVDPSYQQKMAQGLCNGILDYFEAIKE